MKSVALSLVLTAALVAGVFLGTGPGIGDQDPVAPLATADALARVEGELRHLEKRLEDLSRLESEVERLAMLAARAESEAAPLLPASPDGESGDPPGTDGPGADGDAVREAGALLAADGEDGLRAWVRDVIATEREERRLAARRRLEERRREEEELHRGPYGEHNYRVNSLARRLDLSDRQKQSLYLNLIDYNEAIRATRKLEEDDADNRARYREERKRLREEFRQVFVSTLAPEQAEVFSDLPEHQQRPDGSGTHFFEIRAGGSRLITTEVEGEVSGVPPVTVITKTRDRLVELEANPPEPADEGSEEEEEK